MSSDLGCKERSSDAVSLLCRDLPVDPKTLLGSVDIRETDKDYQFVVDVPGLTKDDVKVRVSGDNILTIEGERKARPLSGFICLSLQQLLASTVRMEKTPVLQPTLGISRVRPVCAAH